MHGHGKRRPLSSPRVLLQLLALAALVSLFIIYRFNDRNKRTSVVAAGQTPTSQHEKSVLEQKQQHEQHLTLALLAQAVSGTPTPTLESLPPIITPSAPPGPPPPPPPPPRRPEYVAICLAVRGQKPDLPEWFIHHYYHLNISRFYVMDDGTMPPLSDTPGWGIPRTAITFDYFTPQTRAKEFQQLHAYNECARKYGERHKWLAFIDADEYLEVQKKTTSLESFLGGFDNDTTIGAVGVNWQVHTSSGLAKRPLTSHRKTFTTCIQDDPTQDNMHVKAIVKTPYYDYARNAHAFALRNGARTVGENGDTIPWAFRAPITRDRIGLHHYVLNSKQEYQEKLDRGNGMGSPKNMGFWDHIEGMPTFECDSMAKYEP
ncbi:hypothetical protein HDU87_000321 [Geranomyces variabilis]|uniref:Glycosyltransferase family 92 protein n=1 Tax=Geranomyces variabilis TaxID=109894 RepID=A0AAD5XPR1_9FUNG|nr:hypothetical protein HDU87_000321 [Geranomyces variabilis]